MPGGRRGRRRRRVGRVLAREPSVVCGDVVIRIRIWPDRLVAVTIRHGVPGPRRSRLGIGCMRAGFDSRLRIDAKLV
jgi:hypothetical protein